MRPEFAQAVDPIFLAALEAVAGVEAGREERPDALQDRLIRRFDEAQGRLGNSEEWQLAKYALSAWIDSMLIEDTQWRGNLWWKDNCLEKRFFYDRLAHEEFFERANKAAMLGPKDALEVFYIAVVLGFRGFYNNSDRSYAQKQVQRLRLPETIEGWCQKTAGILQLRQGRPQIPVSVQVGGSARPLSGRTNLLMFSIVTAIFTAIAIAVCVVLWNPFGET